jgi:hypothetical protein
LVFDDPDGLFDFPQGLRQTLSLLQNFCQLVTRTRFALWVFNALKQSDSLLILAGGLVLFAARVM